MAEKSPRKRTPETDSSQSITPDVGPYDYIAGLTLKGLIEQIRPEEQDKFAQNIQTTDLAIVITTLTLAQGDPRRLEFNPDGSITVNNKPKE
jgi:hypothetical protein